MKAVMSMGGLAESKSDGAAMHGCLCMVCAASFRAYSEVSVSVVEL